VKRLTEAADAGNQARQFFMSRRYYLPKRPADRIEELLAKLQEAWADLYTGAEASIRQGGSPGGAERGLMDSGRRAVREEVPRLIEQVEAEFLKILEGDSPRWA